MRKKVLLADSDPVSLLFITELLREKGYTVDAVKDAETCTEEMRENTPDILIVDEAMPGIAVEQLFEHMNKEDMGMKKSTVILLAQLGEPRGTTLVSDSLDIRAIDKKKWTEELLDVLDEVS